MHKFSDFAAEDEKPLDGEKVKIESVLNKEIALIDFRIRISKYRKEGSDRCAQIQFYEKDSPSKKQVLFTGSNVLIGMLEKYGGEIPFETVIKKIDKYYSFT